MALAYALTTWPHLKAFLHRSLDDDLLADQLIDAATLKIENYLGFPIVARTFTEKHLGGCRNICLDTYPVVSVSSIADDQDVPATVSASDYVVIGNEGRLEYIYGSWPRPFHRWTITFDAGVFSNTQSVSEDYRQACHFVVADILGDPQSPVTGESSNSRNIQYAHLDKPLPMQAVALLPAPRARVA